ncbi:MAG: hypothetical protein IIA23_00615 [Chloroflexi bacterium]|nr:hypothetical protein [Chloroflexota bacterium]
MKLKPLTLLLLVAGLAVVAYAALGVSFFQQRSDQDALSSQIESAEAVLATARDVREDLAELPARLDTARQQLATAQTAFPSDLDSNTILQAILGYANESQVRVLEVHTQPPAVEAEGSDGEANVNSYRVLGFDLEVEGTFEQLVAFLAAIEEGATSTSRIGVFSLQESEGRHVLSLEVLSYARSAPAGVSAPETPEDSSGPITDAPDDGETLPTNEASR